MIAMTLSIYLPIILGMELTHLMLDLLKMALIETKQ